MKELLRRTRAWMSAVAFAEAGEWDTARELMPAAEGNRRLSWLERQYAAVAYAEAGEWDAAREMTPSAAISREVTWLERQFAAVAFAEADVAMDAVAVAEGSGPVVRPSSLDVLAECGLRGMYLSFGTVSINELN